ncbi:MAG: hypothetical protein AABY22_01965 [Nanoarchaeota archaeon]
MSNNEEIFCPHCKEKTEYDIFGRNILIHCNNCGYEYNIQLIGKASVTKEVHQETCK